MTRTLPTLVACCTLATIAACKPPPTDADMRRDLPASEPVFASEPLPSPDIEGAIWAVSPNDSARLIYGVPGQPALVALECRNEDGSLPNISITRLAPADEGAGALLALVGNGHIGRIAVDAIEVGGRRVWQGGRPASDSAWEPLAGARAVTLTVPGAGTVTLNRGRLAGEFLEKCRAL
ncbi:hypothetical protein [Qipengyuania nanhaisediminis]|uniref:hypothetical protein n=1 Tax=Qipengyuania nanhaisediminis TaxID=604088 RepID=UPI0038B35F6D